jgi:hypothetical protein
MQVVSARDSDVLPQSVVISRAGHCRQRQVEVRMLISMQRAGVWIILGPGIKSQIFFLVDDLAPNEAG